MDFKTLILIALGGILLTGCERKDGPPDASHFSGTGFMSPPQNTTGCTGDVCR